ncbi:MAG: response regulator [Deltaproteobacteria bacterium]|nr:response regulator [Deltaproteobacteria bacterium]
MAKKILVVDDDVDIVTLEKRILEREGFEVVTAMDGASAIGILEKETFDLILLDIMMPGMDGFEVSRSIQDKPESSPRAPVVFVTARDDSQSMREGFRSGGTVFLSKPFTANQLVRIVKSMIDR